MINFGDILLEERKGKGLSLKEVSDLISEGVTPSYLFRLENGEKKNPSFRNVINLAIALEIPLEVILESFGFTDEFKRKDVPMVVENMNKLNEVIVERLISAIWKYIETNERDTFQVASILTFIENLREVYQENVKSPLQI